MRSLTKHELTQLVGGSQNDINNEERAAIFGFGIGVIVSTTLLEANFSGALIGGVTGAVLASIFMGPDSWPNHSNC